MKKILIILSIIIILPFVVFAGMHILSFDIPDIDDSDLIVKTEIPKDEDNAYFELQKLNEAIDEKGINKIMNSNGEEVYESDLIEILKSSPNDDAYDIESIIQQNQELLTLMESAESKSFYQNPLFNNLESLSYQSSNIYDLPNIRIFNLQLIEALNLFNNGNQEEAINLALKPLHLSVIMMSSTQSIIGHLIAHFAYLNSINTINHIIANGEFSVSELKSIKSKLEPLRFENEWPDRSIKVEYMLAKNTLNYFRKEGLGSFIGNIAIKHNFYFKYNKTLKQFADRTRSIIRGEMAEETASFGQPYELAFTENAVGKILFETFAFRGDPKNLANDRDPEYQYNALIELINSKIENGNQDNQEETPQAVSRVRSN